MCGIIGVKCLAIVDEAQQIVFNGLKKLEYRGYDSWGIASYLGGVSITKKVGAIGDAQIKFFKCGKAIGHTRWATHGSVTEQNCHPHISNNTKIAVVHNGIIDNYETIFQELKKEGYEFLSETDTEVIPNLIQKNMQYTDFVNAFKKTIEELEGSYAVLALHEDKICFAKKDSPLIIGIGSDAIQISSDINAFTKVNKLKYLDDGDWGVINNTLKIFNSNGQEIEKEDKLFVEEKTNGQIKNKHHMLSEIYEQSRIMDIEHDLGKAKAQIKKGCVYFLGCGTSYHACVAGEYYFCKNGINATAVLASEYKRKLNFIDGTVIIISQSGETADLIEAVKEVKKNDVKVIGIINNEHSTLARMSDILIPMQAGKEIAVASTKAFICAIKILHDLVNKTRIKLSEREIKKWHEKSKTIVEKISEKRDLFLIGRNEEFSYALEGALKIKEVSYIRAEGLAGGELKHGTLALIEKDTPVFCIAGKNRQDIINNAQEIKARGGYIIGIDTKEHKVYEDYIPCKDSMLSTIPLQLIAYELSVSKGINPDKPRNLAKSVTVK